MRKIIHAKDYFGKDTSFIIVYETVCMNYTFAIGLDINKPNEFSFFEVCHYLKDNYYILDTGFLDVYKKYNYSIMESFEKKIKELITERLTKKYECGKMTLLEIEALAVIEEGKGRKK